jgi:hypothetical protein
VLSVYFRIEKVAVYVQSRSISYMVVSKYSS